MNRLDDIINRLDFSNWFSFWHEHLDIKGEGDKSWKIRRDYLIDVIGLYEVLNEKIGRRHQRYQIWIWIEDNAAGGDAVFLHTPNPDNNYPYVEPIEKIIKSDKHQDITQFLEERGFNWFKTEGGIKAYKEGAGEPIHTL